MEKDITITWEGKPVVITIGEITWEESKAAIRKSIKVVQKGRDMKKEADGLLQKELQMISSIKKAPFEVTLDNINKLSKRDGEKIYSTYAEINEYDEDDAEGSDDPDVGVEQETAGSEEKPVVKSPASV